MILDKLLEFAATGTDLSHEVGTVDVGSAINLSKARDIGQFGGGKPLYAVIVIETAADGGLGVTGTTSFQVVSDAQVDIAVDGTQSIHVRTKAFVAAELPAGRIISIPLPPGNLQEPYEQFLGVQLVQAVEGEDAMEGMAFLSTHPRGDVLGVGAFADATN